MFKKISSLGFRVCSKCELRFFGCPVEYETYLSLNPLSRRSTVIDVSINESDYIAKKSSGKFSKCLCIKDIPLHKGFSHYNYRVNSIFFDEVVNVENGC
jgi:hypothetical protein